MPTYKILDNISIETLHEAFQDAFSDYQVKIDMPFDNSIAGYGIIDKKTGDIPQIAVNKNYRGNGIASSIMTELVKSTESYTISVLNVEDHQQQFGEFLTKLGFAYYVGQYEMLLKL